MIKLAISGIGGRMGARIEHLALVAADFTVAAGFEHDKHPQLGQKTAAGTLISNDWDKLAGCDCLIEFTTPEATIAHLPYLVKHRVAAVIGTTGITDLAPIKDAARHIPVIFSPNMSVGVNLLFKLLKDAATVLKGYSVDITEAHHVHKKDAPSGTAKKIVDVINGQGFSIKYDDVAAIREGEIVGDHRVVFESSVDRIELSHSAKTRDIFVEGALTAAKWVVGKKPGFYSMNEVLGI